MHAPPLFLKPAVTPKVAIAGFLRDLANITARTFPAWEKALTSGIADNLLDYDQRRAVLEIHPLDDYYFAAAVAMEAGKIRSLFAPDEAAELLSELAEQIDAKADRTDRVVSDVAFFMISRVEIAADIDKQKTPHDQVMKVILQRLGIHKVEATKHLMDDLLYRHTLGEPLALGVPEWWRAFKRKYVITEITPRAPAEIRVEAPTPAKVEPEARKPRRAVSMFEKSFKPS